ncbi:hypothetical protein L596_024800 [Steinernema carpocapsae]|uniref:Carbohydrate kinase FGGY C-terminal domain-containing protein n=1 Tax=Steinernema carpocapsae TaxID=34508 RepID=A0A4U5M5U9_STECR|nr:hypothetical protein L596_024800 [Steinernema carpocapsae]
MGLHPGDMGISLGTSDTVFLTLDQFDCCLEGHIFISPTDPEKFMGMLCFKNGSLVRDRMRGSLTWEEVSQHLKKTSPGNNGNIGFYFDKHEILPNVPAGVYRFGASGTEVKKFDPATEIRAVWEHQCLGKRFYAEKLGFKSREGRLILTGGASNNSDIQQMLADVFDKDVLVCDTREAAALGGAVRAIKAPCRIRTGDLLIRRSDALSTRPMGHCEGVAARG